MTTYVVVWGIEIDADSPQEAARIALDIQRDPESLATVFDVHPYLASGKLSKRYYRIDLSVEGEA